MTNISAYPAARSQTRPTVPLREQHLKGVLDPSERDHGRSRAARTANPCDRRLPIFDGKERFDLVLSRKGKMKVTEQSRAASRPSPMSAA